MYVGNGEDLLKSLMKVQSKCPNCGTTLIFENSARLAKDNGVSEASVLLQEICGTPFKERLHEIEEKVVTEIQSRSEV